MTNPILSRWRFTFASNSATRLGHLRQRGLIALGQLLHALGQRLADAVHLAVDGGFQRGQPFVVHHQRLHLGLGQPGVFGVGFGVQGGLGLFQLLLELGLSIGQRQPLVQRGRLPSPSPPSVYTPLISLQPARRRWPCSPFPARRRRLPRRPLPLPARPARR